MKIIVIGAGVAGLTFGLACQRAGMDVKLYDKARELRNVGGGILLWPHGVCYLKWLKIFDCLNSFQIPIKGCRIVGHHGNQIFSEDYAHFYSLIGGEILPIDRHHFQQTLLAELADHTLELGKTCISVHDNQNSVRVFFSDGSEDEADLLVGADGIFSTVRKKLNHQAILSYANHCWWGGIIEQSHVPSLNPNEVFVSMTQNKMCVVWPTFGQRFMWYLPVKMPLLNFLTEKDGLAQLRLICRDWNDENVHKIINSPSLGKNFNLAIHTLSPQASWSSSHIVLIGDAAHTLSPTLGQGASQAIEDGFTLLQCLQNFNDDVSGLLKKYESLRRAKYYRLAELENQATEVVISDSLEALESFQLQVQGLDLATMYQDLIPLVNEQSCLELASLCHAKY